jgi:hypothetical protein
MIIIIYIKINGALNSDVDGISNDGFFERMTASWLLEKIRLI